MKKIASLLVILSSCFALVSCENATNTNDCNSHECNCNSKCGCSAKCPCHANM